MPPIVFRLDPVAPPVKPPVTVGTDVQVYVVPIGITLPPAPLVSENVKGSLLQALAVGGVTIFTLGFIVATTVKSGPVQLVLPGAVEINEGLTV